MYMTLYRLKAFRFNDASFYKAFLKGYVIGMLKFVLKEILSFYRIRSRMGKMKNITRIE